MPVRVHDVIDGAANGDHGAVCAHELSGGPQGILDGISGLRASGGRSRPSQGQYLGGIRPDDGWSTDMQRVQGDLGTP